MFHLIVIKLGLLVTSTNEWFNGNCQLQAVKVGASDLTAMYSLLKEHDLGRKKVNYYL